MKQKTWCIRATGVIAVAVFVLGCQSEPVQTPADIALAKARQLQSENSHILANIERQKVLKELPDHKEASYLALLSEQEIHLEPIRLRS